MIGQSMNQRESGGRTRIAGIAAALFLLSPLSCSLSGPDRADPAGGARSGLMFLVVIGNLSRANSFAFSQSSPPDRTRRHRSA